MTKILSYLFINSSNENCLNENGKNWLNHLKIHWMTYYMYKSINMYSILGTTITTDGNKNVYTLKELRKDTQYQVRISALTVNGSGPATEWLYKKTYEDDLDGRF